MDGDSCRGEETSLCGAEVEEEVKRNVDSFYICQYTQMAVQEQLVQGWKLCVVCQVQGGWLFGG